MPAPEQRRPAVSTYVSRCLFTTISLANIVYGLEIYSSMQVRKKSLFIRKITKGFIEYIMFKIKTYLLLVSGKEVSQKEGGRRLCYTYI
jgi:hypothetical protein